MNVRVSVVIPTYNRRQWVCQAVESVLAQTFSQYEIVVVDDGSIDGTDKAIASFGSTVRYVWQENQGESVARNRGIELAQGEYIAFLDSDDLWEKDKLLKQVRVLDEKPDVVLVGCASWIIDEQGRKFLPMPVGLITDPSLLTYSALREHNHFGGGSTAVVRKSVLEQVGTFEPELRYGEDWDLWLRTAARGRIEVIPEPLAFIRRHRSSQSCMVSPEVVDRRLADHLRILARNPPINESHTEAGSPDSAMAKQYLRAATDDISIGRLDLAQQCLLESVKWDGGKVLQREGVEFAIERAVVLAEPDFEPKERVWSYFNTALGYLSQVQAVHSSSHTDARTQLSLALASMARTVHNWPGVRANLWQALRSDPRSWRYPGFLGGLLESMMGHRFFQLLRRFASTSRRPEMIP